jgi:hypothetical protein
MVAHNSFRMQNLDRCPGNPARNLVEDASVQAFLDHDVLQCRLGTGIKCERSMILLGGGLTAIQSPCCGRGHPPTNPESPRQHALPVLPFAPRAAPGSRATLNKPQRARRPPSRSSLARHPRQPADGDQVGRLGPQRWWPGRRRANGQQWLQCRHLRPLVRPDAASYSAAAPRRWQGGGNSSCAPAMRSG